MNGTANATGATLIVQFDPIPVVHRNSYISQYDVVVTRDNQTIARGSADVGIGQMDTRITVVS